MRRYVYALLALAAAVAAPRPAAADSVYLALGDSVTFGEMDLSYVPSNGDRGYVGLYADYLAGVTGTRPTVINLAIDGETTASFSTGVGRVTPVVGRTDPILAAQNLNYTANPLLPQRELFRATVAAQLAAGNTIDTVSITQGFNDLLTVLQTGADIATTLAEYRARYSDILSEIRTLLPDADLFVLNYYNPFPGDPTGANPATPVFAAGGPVLNEIIRELAAEYGGIYVDTFTPFVGREAALTFIDEQPVGAIAPPPLPGPEPAGNVHANMAGYQVIAGQVIAAGQVGAVPEPSGLALLGAGAAALVVGAIRRRRRAAA